MNPNNLPEKKICESCHQEFSCGANVGKCWCFEVSLEVAQLEKLREDFQNCLCQDCLQEKISHEQTQIDTKEF